MSTVVLMENFVANVRRHCRDNGISWAELARRTKPLMPEGELQIHVVTISNIMNGKQVPSVDRAEIIARAAGMRPDTAFLPPSEEFFAKRA